MSPQEDSENPPCNNDPLSAGVDVGNHDEDLELDTPPQTAALLSHKFHPYRHPHMHHPLHLHTHHLQAAVTVHSVDAECWSGPPVTPKPTTNPAFDATANIIHHLHSGPVSCRNEERTLTPNSPWASAEAVRGVLCLLSMGANI